MRKRYIISNEVFNKIKSLLDTNKQQKPSISKLSRIYNMDRKLIRNM